LNLKPVLTKTTENQPVVFAKQLVVYSRNYKLQAKTYLKRGGIERVIYIGSLLAKIYIQSP